MDKKGREFLKRAKDFVNKNGSIRSQSGMHLNTLNGRIKTSIISQLITYKRENELTNVALSKKLEISESQVSKILAYHVGGISLDYLVNCIEKLGFDNDKNILIFNQKA
jgi:predicted XRE-type DNA-binding protein